MKSKKNIILFSSFLLFAINANNIFATEVPTPSSTPKPILKENKESSTARTDTITKTTSNTASKTTAGTTAKADTTTKTTASTTAKTDTTTKPISASTTKATPIPTPTPATKKSTPTPTPTPQVNSTIKTNTTTTTSPLRSSRLATGPATNSNTATFAAAQPNLLIKNIDSSILSSNVDDFATYNFNKESSKNLVKRIKRDNLDNVEYFSISLNYDYVNNKYVIHENSKNISVDLNYKDVLYTSLERIDLANSDIYKFSIALKNNIDIMSNDLYGFNLDLIGVASYWHNKDSKDNKNIYSGYIEADLNYDYNLFNMVKLTTSLNNVLYLNKIHNLYQISPTMALTSIDSIMFVKPKIYVSYNFNVNNKEINSSYNNKEYDKDGTEIGLSALLLESNMINFEIEASREISKNVNNIGCSLNVNF